MLTSKKKPKRRGREAPPYGPMVCPLCGSKLALGKALYCPVLSCGWKE